MCHYAPPLGPAFISQIKENYFPTRSVAMIKNQFSSKRIQELIKAEHASEANTAVTTHNSTQLPRTHHLTKAKRSMNIGSGAFASRRLSRNGSRAATNDFTIPLCESLLLVVGVL